MEVGVRVEPGSKVIVKVEEYKQEQALLRSELPVAVPAEPSEPGVKLTQQGVFCQADQLELVSPSLVEVEIELITSDRSKSSNTNRSRSGSRRGDMLGSIP